MIFEIRTAPAPALKNYIFVHDGERLYLIPLDEFANLLVEAGRKFKTIAPSAPCPEPGVWVTWRMNEQVYRLIVKRLKEIQKKYVF